MGTQTSFTFEIDNFSEKETAIPSPKFLSGGCKWYVIVHPKGKDIEDHLSLFLYVANHESLRLGWKRRASYSFILLNQSGKELFRHESACQLFCAQFSGWGVPRPLPLKKLFEKGFLENNKLIVKVQVKVVEAVDEGLVTGNEMLDVQGFQVLYSQVVSVVQLFVKHPDMAVNFRRKKQLLKNTYMDKHLFLPICLNLWKKANTDVSRVQELEERINNLNAELNKEMVKYTTSAAKVSLLEETLLNLKAELKKEMIKSALPKDWLDDVVSSWKPE